MPKQTWKSTFGLALLFLNLATKAQDSTLFQGDELSTQYTHELGRNIRLYNGQEYADYAATIREGHPYFESADWIPGNVVYEGIEYQNIPLKYDLIYDALVIRHFRSFLPIRSDREKLTRFSISGHDFVHLKPDSANSSQLREGYYDRIYNGRSGLYVRRFKQLQEIAKGNDLYKEAISKESYFIQKEGKYYPVGSQQSMLAVFGSRKKEIQQHLKKNRIRYRSNKERALREAVSYYDQITN